MSRVSDEELLVTLGQVAAHGGIRPAAAATRRPVSTIQSHVMIAGRRGLALPDAARAARTEPSLEERSAVTGLRDRVQRLDRQLKDADRALLDRDAQIAAILGLRAEPPLPPDWVSRRRPVGDGSDEPGTPVFLWCDWHIGETVDPAQVYGVNAYDAATTDRRIETLVSRCIYLATTHRRAANAPGGAVILLNGDFVSGWQHEEHIATDWCTPLQAVRVATARLTWALERMREAFGEVTIVCCAGNHGREREGGFHRKPPAKMAMFTAYDWLIYSFLEDTLGRQAGFSFIIPAANNHVIDVQGTRYLVAHGHELGVKGGDGLIGSIGPMMRGRQKAGRSNASFGRHFDVMVLGHFHQNVWMPDHGLIVGNTLKGFDEHAKREAYVATTPSQLMWWTHPVFGPTSPIQVFVENPKRFDR